MFCPFCDSSRVRPLLPVEEQRPEYVCKACGKRWRTKAVGPPVRQLPATRRRKRVDRRAS